MEATASDTIFTTPSERETVLARIFDAPQELVFRTVFDPDLVPDWWGPKRLSLRVDEMDVRCDGPWRFVLRDSAGRVFAFHGVFKEMTPPERAVFTLEFEGLPGHLVVETAEFEDLGDNRTRMTLASLFQSQADRDEAMRWGVRDGALETMDRLARLLTRCAARPPGWGGVAGIEAEGPITAGGGCSRG